MKTKAKNTKNTKKTKAKAKTIRRVYTPAHVPPPTDIPRHSLHEPERYATADSGEPAFILLGRDASAPLLVELWRALRSVHMVPSEYHQLNSALRCADAMRKYSASLGKCAPDRHLVMMALAAVLED